MKKIYCLYSDKEQTELIALSYSIKDRNEITSQYTSGQWFSYKLEDDNRTFYDDSEQIVNVKFPKNAKPKETIQYNREKTWIS